MPTDDLESQPHEARREWIREHLLERGEITTGELQSRFGVSSMTVRRDLATLEQRGSLHRTHGGAVVPGSVASGSLTTRPAGAGAAATRLAAAAVGLVRNGETIFLDSSRIALLIAERIAQETLTLRVITNGVPAMLALAACDEQRLELHAISGVFQRATSSFVGPSAIGMIGDHFSDRAFISAVGVTHEGEVTEADELEASVKRAMLHQASECVLLLDQSIPLANASHPIGSLDEFSFALSDGFSGAEVALLRAHDIRVRDVKPAASAVARRGKRG